MNNNEFEFDEWDESNLKQLLHILQNNSDLKLTLSYKDEQTMSSRITNLLAKMGVPANLKGYAYLRMAITICVEDHDELAGITKNLYPKIANFYATSPEKVEHAMRHAITKAWTYEDKSMHKYLFGRTIGKKSKPTNSAFIATLIDYLTLNNV